MLKTLFNPFIIDLQLFSEGGAEGTGANGADAASHTGETSPAAGVNAGQKTYTDADVQNIIKARVKSLEDKLATAQQTADKYTSAAPLYETLAKKYGLSDATDIAAIQQAVEADDAYYEDEALERGVTVEHLRELKKSQRRADAVEKELDAMRKEKAADEQAKAWEKDARATKETYSDFDLITELQNPEFKNYLRAGIPMKRAYEAIHMDSLIEKAMRTAASSAKQDLANDIRARGSRPAENGLASQSPANVKIDISNLSLDEIRKYNERAARGEKITFI